MERSVAPVSNLLCSGLVRRGQHGGLVLVADPPQEDDAPAVRSQVPAHLMWLLSSIPALAARSMISLLLRSISLASSYTFFAISHLPF